MRSAKKSSSDRIVNVDPELNRPTNADESAPEALVPDIVHTDLQQDTDSQQSDGQRAHTRWARISRRAYELAQQRGFMPGAELSDWLQAEREIDGEARQDAPEDQFTG